MPSGLTLFGSEVLAAGPQDVGSCAHSDDVTLLVEDR
jgi:hypothetical protein